MTATERFIPYSKADIVTLCADEGTLSADEIVLFKDVCKLVSSIFHFKFHASLGLLKESYAPVNPDIDTKTIYAKTEGEKIQLEANLVSELKKLLNAANFEEVTQADLDRALQEESLFKIKLNVDFEQVLFFRRGQINKTRNPK